MHVRRTGKKGQIVIPKELRDQIGLQPGQEVSIRVEGGQIILLPIPEDIVGFLRGWGKPDKGALKALEEDHRWEIEHDEARARRSGRLRDPGAGER